jgi:nucleoside-diphosphate-sugar epimerase
MRILVTGGSGFIGSRVVQQLTAHVGLDVVVLTRSGDERRLQACGALTSRSPARLLKGDFTSNRIAAALRFLRPEVIVHLAMAYHTLGSTSDQSMDAVNYEGTVRLMEAFLAKGGRRFVSAGTCFEYGHTELESIPEETPARPVYPYAAAKARATEAILDHGEVANSEALVLRVFAPYGPLEDAQRIVPQLLDAGRVGRRLELTPGRQVRDYVYVDDVAEAFVAAALQPALPRKQAVYNVCTAAGSSLRQLAAHVEGALGRPLDLAWGKVPYRPDEMMRLVGCNRRIAEDLGWRPAHGLAAGLRRIVEWMPAAARAA